MLREGVYTTHHELKTMSGYIQLYMEEKNEASMTGRNGHKD